MEQETVGIDPIFWDDASKEDEAPAIPSMVRRW
jgi:hypothetical protein